LKIDIFSPKSLNSEIYKNKSERLKFVNYPKVFEKPIFKRLDAKIKRSLHLKYTPLVYFFWSFRSFYDYSKVYILTSPSLEYFLPILHLFDLKTIFIKYTMFENIDIPKWKIN